MSYNYLELVNEVNRKLNEVELTSANFAAAKGFYANIKDSINASIRDINQSHYEWPFNHITADETLSAGVTRYGFPTDASTIDFESFRLKENTTFGNPTSRLGVLSYDDYLTNYIDQEYTTDTSKRSIPLLVFQTPSQEFGVVPAPDQAYEVVYEYYRIPVDMISASDVPCVPERFKHIVIDGAMYHAYMFRSNEQAAGLSKGKFEEGIKRMRIILINKNTYMRSSYISRTNNISGLRVA